MTGLRDATIRQKIEAGDIVIEPYDPALVQPASLDLRLDNQFLRFESHSVDAVDPYERADITRPVTVSPGDAFVLHPNQFVLASTFECVTLPADILGRVEGKSSLGRLALLVHSTAGFIDPGFTGHITLELLNVLGVSVKLWPGMTVAQLSFSHLDGPAEQPYGGGQLGSKYSGQRGPTASRYYRNRRPDPATLFAS